MTAKDIVIVVLIPLILAEFGPWCGWLANKLLPWAAVLRYGRGERATIRGEEWSGDLGDIPGQLTKLAYSLGQLTVGSAAAVRRKISSYRRSRGRQDDSTSWAEFLAIVLESEERTTRLTQLIGAVTTTIALIAISIGAGVSFVLGYQVIGTVGFGTVALIGITGWARRSWLRARRRRAGQRSQLTR